MDNREDALLAAALDIVPSSNLPTPPGRKADKILHPSPLPIKLSFILHNQKIFILLICFYFCSVFVRKGMADTT